MLNFDLTGAAELLHGEVDEDNRWNGHTLRLTTYNGPTETPKD
jgi:hypothetical protein